MSEHKTVHLQEPWKPAMTPDEQAVDTVADILARFPCRAEAGSELDALRRREVAREIVAALARPRVGDGERHE